MFKHYSTATDPNAGWTNAVLQKITKSKHNLQPAFQSEHKASGVHHTTPESTHDLDCFPAAWQSSWMTSWRCPEPTIVTYTLPEPFLGRCHFQSSLESQCSTSTWNHDDAPISYNHGSDECIGCWKMSCNRVHMMDEKIWNSHHDRSKLIKK